MKKKIAVFILFFAIALSCKNDKNTCHLKGKLENTPDTTTLFLVDWEAKKLFDSIQIYNGFIDYKFQIIHPKYFLMHNNSNSTLPH